MTFLKAETRFSAVPFVILRLIDNGKVHEKLLESRGVQE